MYVQPNVPHDCSCSFPVYHYHDYDPIIKIPDHAMQNLKVVFISTFADYDEI